MNKILQILFFISFIYQISSFCSPGYYIDFFGNCNKCNNDCKTCYYYNICTSCKSPKILKNGHCYLCDPGYFYFSSDCIVCSSNCKTCSNSNICTSCLSGKMLSNGYCSDCHIASYYDNSTKSCKKCSDNCKICSDYKHCTSCNNGYFLKNDNDNDNYNNNNNTSCDKCSSNCQICNSYNVCTSCKKGNFYLEGNACKTKKFVVTSKGKLFIIFSIFIGVVVLAIIISKIFLKKKSNRNIIPNTVKY